MPYHLSDSDGLSQFLADQATSEPVKTSRSVTAIFWGGNDSNMSQWSEVRAIGFYDDKGGCVMSLIWKDEG